MASKVESSDMCSLIVWHLSKSHARHLPFSPDLTLPSRLFLVAQSKDSALDEQSLAHETVKIACEKALRCIAFQEFDPAFCR